MQKDKETSAQESTADVNQTAEEQVKASNRQGLFDRFSGNNPDNEDYSDDEVLYGRAARELDELQRQNDAFVAEGQKLIDKMDADPRFAQVILSDTPVKTFYRLFKKEILEGVKNPDVADELFDKAQDEYIDKTKMNTEYEAAAEENQKKSEADLEEFAEENGLSAEERQGVMDTLIRIADEALMNIFTKESMALALKSMRYDGAVAEAGREGEIRGRNAAIEAKLRKDAPKTALPGSMSGKGGSTAEKPKKSMRYNPFAHNE